jgi:hypothetical protein
VRLDAEARVVLHHTPVYRLTMRLVYLLLAAFALLFSAWFFYDGFVNWPRENERGAILREQVVTAQRADDKPTADRLAAELRGVEKHNATDLVVQKALGVIFAIGGAAFLYLGVRPRREQSGGD